MSHQMPFFVALEPRQAVGFTGPEPPSSLYQIVFFSTPVVHACDRNFFLAFETVRGSQGRDMFTHKI